MKFKIIGIMLLYSINLFSIEIDSIYDELKECPNYQEEDNIREGIFNWISSVNSSDTCDMEQINFLSSNRNRLTIKTNLSLLKSKYEFCEGVENLGKAFQEGESKLSEMKIICNNPMRYTEKKASESHNKQEKFREELREHHNNINDLQVETDKLIDDIYGG